MPHGVIVRIKYDNVAKSLIQSKCFINVIYDDSDPATDNEKSISHYFRK